MKVFNGVTLLEDYISILCDAIGDRREEVFKDFPFYLCEKYLSGIAGLKGLTDETLKNKAVCVLQCIDSDDLLDFDGNGSASFHLDKKMPYFLKCGVLFGKYPELLRKLSPKSIETLTICFSTFMDDTYESESKYVPLLLDDKLLKAINKREYNAFRDDIFLGILRRFDATNEDTLYTSSFRSGIIAELNSDGSKIINEGKEYFLSQVAELQKVGVLR